MKDAFSSYHPLVNFLYFALVLVFTMVFTHPVCLAVSMGCAFWWSCRLGGRKALRFNLLALLPMMLFMAAMNPVFSHEGATILAYFPDGNPLTLESIWYGVGAAGMLAAVVCWFSCYNKVMTSDKFIYLFGRIIPALSLVLSMVLRFVPKFKGQLSVVSNAQKCVGRDAGSGSPVQKAKHGVRILSVMVTWALENAIETADSMKSRGYGLPGRSSFSLYRFDGRDQGALAFLLSTGAFIVLMALRGGMDWQYYPIVKGAGLSAWSVSAWLCYLALCGMPMILNCWEERTWKRIASNI